MKSLFVFDALGFLFRAYYALPPMTNDKGEETHALFGFIKQIQKVLKDFDPEYCVAVFDGPENKASRTALCPLYKSNREKAPEDLVRQMAWAEEFCKLIGIATLTLRGVEADDTIGSIAKWTEANNIELLICAQDKDLCQLVSKKTKMLNVHKNNLIIDRDYVIERFGVPPEKIVDFLAIVGDSSDNVIGMKGMGPKTAAKWLTEAGSLQGILDNPEKVQGGKKKELIESSKERLILSQKLVSLQTDIPFPKEPSFFKRKPLDLETLRSFFKQFKFHSLMPSLTKGSKEDSNAHPEKQDNACTTPAIRLAKTERILVDSDEALNTFCNSLEKATKICFDTETTGLDPMQDKLVGIGFAFDSKKTYYIPLNSTLSKEDILEKLKTAFRKTQGAFFAHNLKFDLLVLWQFGLFPKHFDFDTMLASYLLFAAIHKHSLDYLALEFLDLEKTPLSDLIGTGKKQITMLDVPIEKVAQYCSEDVEVTWHLRNIFEKKLSESGLEKLFYDVEMPLLALLAEMQKAGIYVEKEPLAYLGTTLKEHTGLLEKEIFALADQSFNLNSPKQLSSILFEKLALDPPKKTKTGFSTNSDVLEQLKKEHPIAEKILTYRSYEKLRSTYVDALPEYINPKTGRIHCTFNQTMTATGRLSCHSPNLQNIPVRTEEGLKIRKAFCPKEGSSFVAADYSQIELRVLAHLSKDDALIEAFQKGEDIHTHTASLIYDIPLEKVSSHERFCAKAVNFGIVYGQGPFGLSQNLKIDIATAKSFIEAYFKRYPKVKTFLDSCKECALKKGLVKTLLGRIRHLPDIHSKNPHLKAASERLSTNTPVQGTGADIIKLAMIKLRKLLKEKGLRGFMVLQIHDEILLEVPDNEVEVTKETLKEAMEEVICLRVPLVVTLKVGKNWAEC